MARERLARWCAGLIAALAVAGILANFIADVQRGDGALHALWWMARFFTNVGNTLVIVVFGQVAARGTGAVSARWQGLSVAAIVLVGVTYAVLLRGQHHPVGLHRLSSELLHDVVPPAAVLWWLVLGPRGALDWGDPLRWLALPLGYSAYAELRGSVEGSYPYFFLNPVKIGWGHVFLWLLVLGAGFWLTGAALCWFDRRGRPSR